MRVGSNPKERNINGKAAPVAAEIIVIINRLTPTVRLTPARNPDFSPT